MLLLLLLLILMWIGHVVVIPTGMPRLKTGVGRVGVGSHGIVQMRTSGVRSIPLDLFGHVLRVYVDRLVPRRGWKRLRPGGNTPGTVKDILRQSVLLAFVELLHMYTQQLERRD